ncbi:unnamed protein product [Durusdinium trenchii]|uniref:Uncharacterized protein n=2 Tax=Durusdinium trenchii TaxID=1381693 RepID=A0ABP0STH3_9DINO
MGLPRAFAVKSAMSLQEFHTIFGKEIDRYLAKLASRGKASSGHRDEQPHLPELKRIAHQMADSILKRLAVNATKWGLDQDALNGKLTPEAPQKVPKKSARLAQLKARCQDLETELHRHLEEEEKRKSEVLQRFKAECDSILRSQEEELLQLRRAAVTQEADAAQRGVAHFKQEVLEQLQRIQKQLAETKDHVSELDRLKQGLDNIEERQRRAIPPIEALLASTMDTWPEDTEDELLAANIRKGEQVCKRLRRHQSK